MPTFSFAEAFGSGFNLIARKPLAILAWALFLLLATGIPIALIATTAIPAYVRFFSYMSQHVAPGDRPDFSRMMQLESPLLGVAPLLMVLGIVTRAMLAGAVFRAVLEPEKESFSYLRIGPQELWLGLLMLVFGVMSGIAGFGVAIGGLVVFGILALLATLTHAPQALIALFGVLAFLIAMGVLIWALLRLALAFPMTFAEREFRLFESWELTRGQAFKMFGLALALGVVVGLIGLVIDVIGFAAFGGAIAAGGTFTMDRMEAFFAQPPQVWLPVLAPWLVVAGIVGSVLTAAFSAILLAPWAVVYRQLRPGAATPPAAEPGLA